MNSSNPSFQKKPSRLSGRIFSILAANTPRHELKQNHFVVKSFCHLMCRDKLFSGTSEEIHLVAMNLEFYCQ